tara:strand:+ start:1582 stop:1983 length:402 start_codon:yes stop_codon:yes gene_type:complete
MSQLSQLIECPICFDICNQPRMLTNCGHTFCTKCLKSNLNITTTHIKCFLCNQNTKLINNDINSLKINYMFMSIVEYIKNLDNLDNLDEIKDKNKKNKTIILSNQENNDNEIRCCSRQYCATLSQCMNRRHNE